VTLLRTFLGEYKLFAVAATLFTAFGCVSAYNSAGRRYRLVREYID